ncbi:hypothetical protein CMU19_04260 [Elizabethkingia anophelis]|nr:hypothetical protein [Elizabethkingia anophelis]
MKDIYSKTMKTVIYIGKYEDVVMLYEVISEDNNSYTVKSSFYDHKITLSKKDDVVYENKDDAFKKLRNNLHLTDTLKYKLSQWT